MSWVCSTRTRFRHEAVTKLLVDFGKSNEMFQLGPEGAGCFQPRTKSWVQSEITTKSRRDESEFRNGLAIGRTFCCE